MATHALDGDAAHRRPNPHDNAHRDALPKPFRIDGVRLSSFALHL